LFDFSHSAMFQLAFEICTRKKSCLPIQSNCMRLLGIYVLVWSKIQGDAAACCCLSFRAPCNSRFPAPTPRWHLGLDI
jgi:hypothetical protein